MKKFKRIMALVIAMAMVLGLMSISAFADDTANLTADTYLKISGLEAGDTVNYYKVIEWKDNTGWAFTDNFASIDNTYDTNGAVTARGTGYETADNINYYVVGASPTEKTTRDGYGTDVLKYMVGLAAKVTTDATTGTATVQAGNEKVLGRVNSKLAGQLAIIAKGIDDADFSETISGTTSQYDTDDDPALTPGLYIVLVDAGKQGVMYNPIFVAGDFDDHDPAISPTPGDTDFFNEWEVDVDDSYSDEAIAKKSTVTVDKFVTDDDATDTDNDNKRDFTNLTGVDIDGDETKEIDSDEATTADVGEIVKFTIQTTIPEYSDNYTWAKFNVKDTLSEGLTLVVDGTHPITVTAVDNSVPKADGSGVESYTATSSDYTVKTSDGTTDTTNGKTGDKILKVDFTTAFILARYSAVPVEITYYAKVGPDAVTNVDTTNNTVEVEYSNNPTDEEGVGIVKDVTNQYSFSLDAKVFGNEDYETSELIKVGLDANGDPIVEVSDYDNGNTDISPLKDAVFGLFTTQAAATAAADGNGTSYADLATNKATNGIYTNAYYEDETTVDGDGNALEVARFKTNDLGKINIRGLDAGEYYLVETKAPSGFIADKTVRKITISAEFVEKTIKETLEGIDVTYTTKVLDSYTVKVEELKTGGATTTSTYKMTYGEDASATDQTTGVTTFDQSPMIELENSSDKDSADNDTAAAADNSHFIINTEGTALPSTGGIGTTIFYVVGAILVIGAGVILITRRRMDA